MKEYVSEKFNIIYKDLPKYSQVSLEEAIKSSTKENFKCFQFRHEYRDSGTSTFIRIVNFNDGIIYSDWS